MYQYVTYVTHYSKMYMLVMYIVVSTNNCDFISFYEHHSLFISRPQSLE